MYVYMIYTHIYVGGPASVYVKCLRFFCNISPLGVENYAYDQLEPLLLVSAISLPYFAQCNVAFVPAHNTTNTYEGMELRFTFS
jgi:hypothetical protein